MLTVNEKNSSGEQKCIVILAEAQVKYNYLGERSYILKQVSYF